MFISDIGQYFPFLWLSSSSDFGVSVMVSLQNEFGSFLSSAIFWKSLNRIDVSSSLNFWQNSPLKPSGLGLLFVGRFFITASIFILDIGVLKFYISAWLSFERLYFSKNLSVSSKLSILLAYSCLVISYVGWYFCVVCLISPFSFLILLT